MKSVCLLFFVLLLLAVSGCGADNIGPAPAFTVESLSEPGKTVALSDVKGKPVLLEFWATWCGPCRELAPEIERIYQENKAGGLEVIAITNESRQKVEQYAASRRETFPLYLDSGSIAEKRYNLRGVPTVVVIDRRGQMVLNEAGPMVDQIKIAVERALKK